MPEINPTPPIVLRLWAHDTPNSGRDTRGAPDEAADLISELLATLEALTEHYVSLVNCGDCGRWDPEDEGVVKRARSTIAKVRGGEAE